MNSAALSYTCFSKAASAYFYVLLIKNIQGGREDIICPVFLMRKLGHRLNCLANHTELIRYRFCDPLP